MCGSIQHQERITCNYLRPEMSRTCAQLLLVTPHVPDPSLWFLQVQALNQTRLQWARQPETNESNVLARAMGVNGFQCRGQVQDLTVCTCHCCPVSNSTCFISFLFLQEGNSLIGMPGVGCSQFGYGASWPSSPSTPEKHRVIIIVLMRRHHLCHEWCSCKKMDVIRLACNIWNCHTRDTNDCAHDATSFYPRHLAIWDIISFLGFGPNQDMPMWHLRCNSCLKSQNSQDRRPELHCMVRGAFTTFETLASHWQVDG